jgi:hypothetical protein
MKILTDEHKRNIGIANKGKPRSKALRKRVSETLKKKYALGIIVSPRGMLNKIPWNKGKGKGFLQGGYRYLHSPNHPHRNKDGCVFEHRLVMEKKLRRFLSPQERIHHINQIRTDNRIQNLKLFKNDSEHTKFHLFSKSF